MTSRTLVILAGALAFAAALPPGASAETADATKPLVLAQGPQTEQDKEKEKAKRREDGGGCEGCARGTLRGSCGGA